MDMLVDSIYSGVVSLQGFRMVLFLSDLNKILTWATDIGNAYLEAYTYTKEKLVICASPEFGNQAGHLLIISNTLRGL